MTEKKKFFIPRNYQKSFEWIPGISGWHNLVVIPIGAIDYAFFSFTSFSISNKIVGSAILSGIPYLLIATRPVRENVPMYKHLYWKLKFMLRPRIYHYKKEGYFYAIQEKGSSNNTDIDQAGTTSTNKHSKFNPLARFRKRDVNHPRPADGAMSKSVSNQFGADK